VAVCCVDGFIYGLVQVFSKMDINNTGYLNFEEFVICIWDFLSQDLRHLAFNLFDEDRSMKLHKSEVHQMAKYVYGVEHGKNRKLDSTIDTMRTDADGNVSFEEFVEQTKRNQTLLWPAFVLQNTLWNDILGEAYWRTMIDIRNSKMNGLDIHSILMRREDEISDSEIVLDV